MDVNAILKCVKSGEIEIQKAEELLKKLPYEDLGYAKIDHHRKVRQGFEEVIYCQGKETAHLVGICSRMAEERINVLGTRASGEQAAAVMEAVPEFTYEPVSSLLKAEFRKQEGALPGVVAGLVDVPVIAVPTSVGYGASFGGLSALLTMINSCANGITVVNIDNGYGAGYVATQINRLAVQGYEKNQ